MNNERHPKLIEDGFLVEPEPVELPKPVDMHERVWYHLPNVGEAMWRMRRNMRRITKDGRRGSEFRGGRRG